MEWLNRNAGGLQAITAMIIAIFTLVLIGVTWWYAYLTKKMAATLREQLVASFQPNIGLTLTNRFQGKGKDGYGGQHENVSGTIIVTNKGNLPLKVLSVAMKLIYDKEAFPTQTIRLDAQQRLVSPGQTTEFSHLTMDVAIGGSKAPYEQIAQIHCSDLAGVSNHSFSVSSHDGDRIYQSMGLQSI